MTRPRADQHRAVFRTGLRLLTLVGIIILVNSGVHYLTTLVNISESPQARTVVVGAIVASLLLYALLMAVPFVPGIEIGLSLLMMQGAAVAPYVFLATLTGLSLSFLLGRYLPYKYLHGAFSDLGLSRAADLIKRMQPLDRPQRLALIRSRLPGRLAGSLLRSRYVMIAVALNIPGNALIGGGGGIAMMAGISHLFSPVATIATFAIAVSPVAIVVYFYGTGIFG